MFVEEKIFFFRIVAKVQGVQFFIWVLFVRFYVVLQTNVQYCSTLSIISRGTTKFLSGVSDQPIPSLRVIDRRSYDWIQSRNLKSDSSTGVSGRKEIIILKIRRNYRRQVFAQTFLRTTGMTFAGELELGRDDYQRRPISRLPIGRKFTSVEKVSLGPFNVDWHSHGRY